NEETARGEEARHDCVFAPNPPCAVPRHESLMQIRRNDAELRTQIEHIPASRAERTNARRPLVVSEGVVVVCQKIEECGLAGAVGAEDRGVLASANRQRE